MNFRVRFAPSPTGLLHVGNARTALISWLLARKNGGWFLLRIDDTDTERSKAEYEEQIESSLIWMGLDWDEKTRQATRTDRYDEQIEKLKIDGYLYPCYETPEELSLKRKTLLSRGLPPVYDRSALKLSDEQIKKYEAEGRKPHWRFKLNHKPIEWDDMVRGETKFDGEKMSDPVVIREDGRPLYHLCSVIDDIDYGITHVLRGDDHVSNTATHVQMFEALGANPPIFAHVPLLSGMDGGKLSKRAGSTSVRDIKKEEGIEAMALVSLLSRVGTSDPVEPFTDINDIVNSFDLSKFSRGMPKFDYDELNRLNAKIIHQMPFSQAQVRLANLGMHEADEQFWLAVRPNITKLREAKEWWDIVGGISDNENAVNVADEDKDFIKIAAQSLPAEPWDENTWKEWTDNLKEQTGRKGKSLFMPLRIALTSIQHGPELANLLPILGRKKVLERLSL